MPNRGGKSRSRRRNPDEFGVSSLSLGGSSRRKRKDLGRLDLETYLAARLASGLTTAGYYAQAARELAELLERGYATAEKRCANALWEDCLLAVSRMAHLERTVETDEALDAVVRAARRVLPAARRAELERAHRRAAVARKRRERRSGEDGRDQGDGSDDDHTDSSDDDVDVESDAINKLAPHLARCERARAQKSATFLDLPGDVLGLVLERLHPHALARAACVSREWRARAESADRWRALALAAFGETRCFAAATRPSTKDKNASTRNFEELPNRGAPTSPRSWRRAFLVARKRWPEMAPRKHTGRAFCETCQTLAWFPGFGGPSFRFGDGGGGESESGGVVFTSREKNTRASCGCAPATFAPRRRLKKKTTSTESSSTRKEGLPDYSVSAAAAALPFAVTPRRAVRFLFRVARREARRRNGSESDSSSDATFSSSSGSGSSSSDDEGERRLWQRNQTKSE
jgi:hypothetical protein